MFHLGIPGTEQWPDSTPAITPPSAPFPAPVLDYLPSSNKPDLSCYYIASGCSLLMKLPSLTASV